MREACGSCMMTVETPHQCQPTVSWTKWIVLHSAIVIDMRMIAAIMYKSTKRLTVVCEIAQSNQNGTFP